MLRNSPLWRTIARLLLVVAAVGVFVTGGDFAANYLIDRQRNRQLQELGGIAIRRSETVVDYGISALRGFAQKGNVGCDASALQSLRLHVYRSGVIKDIRIVRHDGTVLCSAFTETLEFDKGWATRDAMLLTIGGAVRLFRVEQFFGTALGAMIDVDSEHGLAGIMAVDGSLFDVMPAELRNQSVVSLRLANGEMIASTASDAAFNADEPVHTLTVPSYRFPLQSVIRIERTAFEGWHRELYLPIMALFGLIGLLFGALLARGLFRPRSPLEELDRAIAQGQIRPYYQPIFDLRSGAITGAEILARWIKPDGTVIPPARFIELAEDSGRIQALTWQLLSAALVEIRSLLKADENFHLSMNISPSHFATDDFVQQLRDTVSATDIRNRQITLELTERENFDDPDLAAAIVAEVRGHGFKVAIDDVGIGHSGLSQIQRLRADILKVDKFFIDSVVLDPAAASMIAMLVRLAREMKMSIIAEGIEDRQQLDALVACGIAMGQGYVVSPPLPPLEFLDFVAARRAERETGTARIRAA